MSKRDPSVAILGAGPYGLAAAAHLRAWGLQPLAFGEPMSFWENSMPVGMLLRSGRQSSSISDPDRALTLDRYEQSGATLPAKVTIDAFVAYAKWFCLQAMPQLDSRRVVRIDRAPGGFSLLLDDAEVVRVGRVVVAAGIEPFAWVPQVFESLPPGLALHSSAVREVAGLRGRRVLVVGAGQSALEGAALLHEAGAEVEVLARSPAIKWIRAVSTPASAGRKRLRQLMYPPTEVGPPGMNLIAAMPDVWRRLPARARAEVAVRCTPPMGSPWLVPRLADVPLTLGRRVVEAQESGGRAVLTLDDGTRREVDTVVLGTGYRVDVTKYSFLGPELLASLRVADGYPRLGVGLESSVPGLHFVGAPSAAAFGPVMRFVAGTWYAGPALARRLAGRPPRVVQPAW